MLGDIKSARKLLSGLDAENLEDLRETLAAANECASLEETAIDLKEALISRAEYLKAAGQTIEEDDEAESVGA